MFLPQLGLKGSSQLDQINDRLQYNPIAYEFYTDANDFTDEGYQRLYDAIQYVKDAGIKNIILHHPMKFQDHHSEVVAPEKQYPDLYRFIEFTTEKLLYLADDLDVQVLVHGGYAGPESRYFVSLYPSVEDARNAVYQRLDRFADAGGDHIILKIQLHQSLLTAIPFKKMRFLLHNYRLAFDTSHCFIELHGNNQKLASSLEHLKDRTVHYHLVDSMGKTHDSLTLGHRLKLTGLMFCLT